jgi:hypothetical protein
MEPRARLLAPKNPINSNSQAKITAGKYQIVSL